MAIPTRFGWWLVGGLVGMQVLGLGATAGGEERLRAGMKDLALVGAYSVSHNLTGTVKPDTVTGFQLIPHLGYVVTDERGEGWLRGNFEVLAEPTLLRLEAKESATLVGLAVLGRWVFATSSVIHPYLEAGVGVLNGDAGLIQTQCDVNFLLEGGTGAMLFVSEATALTVGYRFQHISNGGRCSPNFGLNSSMFIVGVSYFFR